jgi:prolycopene isomerase
MYVAHLPDGPVRVPIGSLEEFIDVHARALPKSAAAIRGLFELAATVHREAHELPAALATDQLEEASQRFPTLFAYRRATVGAVLDATLDDPRAKMLCGIGSSILGLSPASLPFSLFSQLLMSYLAEGGFYVEGGAQRLIDALLHGFERDGGELLLETRATRIVVEAGRVAGVELDGQRVEAPLVVSNAGALQTYEIMVRPDELPPRFLDTLRRLTPSLSGAMIFGASTGDAAADGLDHTNLLTPTWNAEEAHRRSLEGRPRGGLGLTVPSTVDATLAPPRAHVFALLAIRPYAIGGSWREERPRFAAQLLDELRAWAPHLAESVVFSDSATPETLERFTLNTGGAIYGWENTLRHIGRLRPSQRSPIPGLLLAGHWTRPGPGFLRATVSGIHAAQMALADLGDSNVPFQHESLPPVAR